MSHIDDDEVKIATEIKFKDLNQGKAMQILLLYKHNLFVNKRLPVGYRFQHA